MKYKWDEDKRLENINKHGIDFVGCEAVFDGYTVTIDDNRFPYYERRYITFGLMKGRVVAISHTETEDVIRIISTRKATRYEQEAYFQNSPFPRITN